MPDVMTKDGFTTDEAVPYRDPDDPAALKSPPGVTEEDWITRRQDANARAMHALRQRLDVIQREINEVSTNLNAPGMLRDSGCVRFFSLFSQLRDGVKEIDEAIGAEIDTESMAKDRNQDIGRLQGKVQRYLERIGAKSAAAEGKLVTVTHKLWASATNIGALKKHAVTKGYVKETVSTQTLSSWVRELDQDDQGMPELPEELEDAIKVSDKVSVSAKKA